MVRDALSRQLQPTRREILIALKKSGGLTAEQLSNLLGITPMGVRRHLITLERDGLVTYKTVQRGVGRPTYVYHLTDLADELFPKSYAELTQELLKILEESEGAGKVEALFAKRAERLAAAYRPRLEGKDLAEQVAELARLQSEAGYLAEWEKIDENTFILKEHNCTIARVASHYPQACTFELTLFQNLLDGEVTREKHITSGDEGCFYVIRRHQAD